MRKNETILIRSLAKRQLTAKGYDLLNRMILKASKMHGVHRYSKDFKPLKEQITYLFHQLVFDKRLTYEEINEFYKSINDKILIKGLHSN